MLGLWIVVAAFFYAGAFVMAAVILKKWKWCVLAWTILSIPLGAWLWDYPFIKYRHEEACRNDGGLRILIQPVIGDRIRLDGNFYDQTKAKDVLRKFYPKIKFVEAVEDSVLSNGKYFSFSVDPESVSEDESKLEFKKIELVDQPKGIFTLTETPQVETNGGLQQQTLLMVDGRIYAQWISYVAVWNKKGLLPNAWTCFYYRENPDYELIKLLTERKK